MKQPKQGKRGRAAGEESSREVPTGSKVGDTRSDATPASKPSAGANKTGAKTADPRDEARKPNERAAAGAEGADKPASDKKGRATTTKAVAGSSKPRASEPPAARRERGRKEGTEAAAKRGSEPRDPSSEAAERSPVADLAHGVNGVPKQDKAPAFTAGATVAPPARRARPNADSVPGEELGEAADEQIWSDQAPSTQPLASATRKLAAELAGERGDATSQAESRAAFRLTRGSSGDRLREAAGFGGGDRLREAAAFGSAQSLLSTDYYFRQYGAHGMRSLTAEVDDFGFDPHVDERMRPLLEALCKRYFRVEVVGAENVPQAGRALLVANRSGALPWDGLILRTALRAKRPELSPLRWLSEDSVIHYPFMGVLLNRLGAVRACPENAERLLAQNRLITVFPEGAQGSRKLFRDRYRLQRFGRGGYVKLALKFDVPIVPIAIIGGEETNPVLGRSRLLGRLLGSDSLPITPTFPWLGVAGLLPAPVKWKIIVGEPIDLSAHGTAAADDALVVHRLNEQIRSSLQALVDQGKRTRGGALFG